MFTKDIVKKYGGGNLEEEKLTTIAKSTSWVLVLFLVILAITLREKTSLVQLLDRKIDLLIQLSPAFIVGIRTDLLKGPAVLAGLCVGVIMALVLAFGNFDFVENGKIAGFHPGVVSVVPNLIIAIAVSYTHLTLPTKRIV